LPTFTDPATIGWNAPVPVIRKASIKTEVRRNRSFADSATRLRGDFELHGRSFLHHRRSIANSPAGENVIDPQPRGHNLWGCY